MKPKEKAKELVEKFLLELRGADRYNYNLEDMNVFIAKQCALIDVKNTIEMLAEINNNESYNVSKYVNYYQEVKQEIEKL